MTLLCCFAPGQPRLDLLRHLILTGVSCPGKEVFDNLYALGARLAQAPERGSHRVAVIAPGPEENWRAQLAARLPGPGLDLIVILPEAGRQRALPRHPSNVILVSDSVHPLLLLSYLTSVVTLRGGRGKMTPVPLCGGLFSSSL